MVAALLVAWGGTTAQESPKFEKTLTFVREAVPAQAPAAPAFTVPSPTLVPAEPAAPGADSAAEQAPKGFVTEVERAAAQVYSRDEEPGILPGPSRLFRRLSEKDVFDEIRIAARRKPGTIRPIFPEDTILSKDVYTGRSWSPMIQTVEPNYVGHGRLYFEQQNFERAGWDFGIAQPLVSLGVFYADLITMPYQFWTRPLQRYDSSAGKCLPGDPSPLLWYPPELSASGAGAEAATIVGVLALFPR